MKQKGQNLQEKLAEAKKKLLTNSKDAHFAESLLDEILSLKGQMDVEPMETYVRTKDVIKTYDFESYTIKETTKGILFEIRGGLHTLIEPRCRAPFEMLVELLHSNEKFLNISDEDKTDEQKELAQNIEMALGAWSHVLQMPLGVAVSPLILFTTAREYIKVFSEEADRILKSDLVEESIDATVEEAKKQISEEFVDEMAESIKNKE